MSLKFRKVNCYFIEHWSLNITKNWIKIKTRYDVNNSKQ